MLLAIGDEMVEPDVGAWSCDSDEAVAAFDGEARAVVQRGASGGQTRGVECAKITFEIAPDQADWGVEIAGKVKAWAKALLGRPARRTRTRGS